MINPYHTLGVKPGADIKDVKKAYRSLANKHHPDKQGGNEEKFKEIKEAYELIKLGKEKSKANQSFNEDQYTEYTGYKHNHYEDANDFSFRFHNQHHKANRFVNVSAEISIHNAVCGGKRSLSIQPHGQRQASYIEIEIPIGVIHQETIRYPGLLGNGNIDLNVTFFIRPDRIWTLDGLNLTRKEEFSFWDLINGTTREIPTISNGKVRLKVPALTEPGTKMKLKSLGAVSRQNVLHKGDMYVEIFAKLPKNIPTHILSAIKDL